MLHRTDSINGSQPFKKIPVIVIKGNEEPQRVKGHLVCERIKSEEQSESECFVSPRPTCLYI